MEVIIDLQAPTPAPNEILVRVRASSVNPVDNGIAAGMLKQMGVDYDLPAILGRDYAGVVERVGDDVTNYAVGDNVFGFLLHANPTVRDAHLQLARRVPEIPRDRPMSLRTRPRARSTTKCPPCEATDVLGQRVGLNGAGRPGSPVQGVAAG